jgi:recombinational DNA repair protein RecR
MQPVFNKRYYTPQFSPRATISVRRFAWALGVPMTKTVDHIIKLLPTLVNPSSVCQSCKDPSSCAICVFCPKDKGAENLAAR